MEDKTFGFKNITTISTSGRSSSETRRNTVIFLVEDTTDWKKIRICIRIRVENFKHYPAYPVYSTKFENIFAIWFMSPSGL